MTTEKISYIQLIHESSKKKMWCYCIDLEALKRLLTAGEEKVVEGEVRGRLTR
jgi:hypothetical protein